MRFHSDRFFAMRLLGDRVGMLLYCALLILIVLELIFRPSHAQAAAMAAASTQVNVAPLLQELVSAAATALLTVLTAAIVFAAQQLQKRFGIKNDVDIRNSMLQIAADAVMYGTAFADSKVTEVRGVDVGNPVLASAIAFFVNHATDEIAHFKLSDADAVRIVQAAYGRLHNYAGLGEHK
jgi:hypothetical protein